MGAPTQGSLRAARHSLVGVQRALEAAAPSPGTMESPSGALGLSVFGRAGDPESAAAVRLAHLLATSIASFRCPHVSLTLPEAWEAKAKALAVENK